MTRTVEWLLVRMAEFAAKRGDLEELHAINAQMIVGETGDRRTRP